MAVKIAELHAQLLVQSTTVSNLQTQVAAVKQSMCKQSAGDAIVKPDFVAESKLQDVISTKITELEAQTHEQISTLRDLRAQVIAVEQSMLNQKATNDTRVVTKALPTSDTKAKFNDTALQELRPQRTRPEAA